MARSLPVISLFSGGLGLDLGMEQAGFEVRVAVECNKFAAQTIRNNRPLLPLIEKRLEEVPTEEILQKAGLKQGEPFVVTGGPSCQSFSTAGHRGSVNDPRGSLFESFLRVVKEARPRFFVMENVKGVLSAAVKHRPLKDRGPGHPALGVDEELGSAFRVILQALRDSKYYVAFDLLNAADHGVPQVRERVIIIGSRDGEPVALPAPTHAREPTGDLLPWMTLRKALEGLDDPQPTYQHLCPAKEKFLRLVPEGGNWRNLPEDVRAEAMGGAHTSWGGRVGFFRRLAWDRPAPALTTRPDSKATMLCHPTELRPLSIKEYTRLQQFPDGWEFSGGLPQQYIQVGNAVPIGLGKAIGEAIRLTTHSRKRLDLLGAVVCANSVLVERMAARPKTILNPVRMREVKGLKDAKEWLAGKDRRQLLDLLKAGNEGGNEEAPNHAANGDGAGQANGRKKRH